MSPLFVELLKSLAGECLGGGGGRRGHVVPSLTITLTFANPSSLLTVILSFIYVPFALCSLPFSPGPTNIARTCESDSQWGRCSALVHCDSPVKAEVFFLNSYTSFISGHFLFDTSLVIPDDMLHQRECGKQEQWDLKPHPLSVPHNRAPGLCQEA